MAKKERLYINLVGATGNKSLTSKAKGKKGRVRKKSRPPGRPGKPGKP